MKRECAEKCAPCLNIAFFVCFTQRNKCVAPGSDRLIPKSVTVTLGNTLFYGVRDAG